MIRITKPTESISKREEKLSATLKIASLQREPGEQALQRALMGLTAGIGRKNNPW